MYNKSMARYKWILAMVLPAALLAGEAVKLDTGSGTLAGTLELPEGKAPVAVVLIIAGSGPTDRDGNSSMIKGKNDSLKMLAEGLAAHGIASLRYDKRGIAESKSAAAKEDALRFEMYVDDAVRWGEYLRKDSRFRALVIAGHSEGSLIGMIAARKLAANGFVSIAGAGQPAGQIILEQLRGKSLPAELMKQTEDAVKALEGGHTVESVSPALAALFRPSVQPYLISWFRYDPAREIANLKMPVLILQGTTDIQVTVQDAKRLSAANPAAKLAIIEGMNHVMKDVPADMSKQIASYGDPALPISAKLMDEVVALVKDALIKKISAAAQIDQDRAASYFKEAAALCEREGGRLWGVSLCGPMVFADAATHSIATNQPAPEAKQPLALGFANAAMDWGGIRWSTFVWQIIPTDQHARGRMMLHELFHRVQPQLGLLLPDGHNEHLDTIEGRYWMQLEWRALAKALGASGPARAAAASDALAFRSARRKVFPGAGENERPLEINEGLAQYTGTVVVAASSAEAQADAIDQLAKAAQAPTFIRGFAYPSGAAYGILLDAWSPGWTHRVKATDDLGQLLMASAKIQPSEDAAAAAKLYGGAELRVAEDKREVEQKARLAELRRRFVEGPVLTTPGARSTTFTTAGMTPIPGAGTVYPGFRATNEWGSLEAATVLMSVDRSKLIVPAPASVESGTLNGDGWMLKLAPGWTVVPGSRAGDFQVVRGKSAPPAPK
jgi:pimeloyl-ACP methyl ester carboxylesterase